MKDSISRTLKIKLIGGSLLKVAVFTAIWFGGTALVYNTGLKDMIRGWLDGIFGGGYHNVTNLFQSIFFPVYIIGIIILIYEPVVRAINYLQQLVESIDTLFSKDDGYIQLAGDLHPVETQLNSLKQTAIKNERVAAQAEQRKNDLVMYLAHDIKTPLTSIIGYLNLLDEAPDMPMEQKARYIGITLEKAYRLEELINEFFDITRFNLQSIILNKGKINLSFMLQQIADEFYPMLAPQGKEAVVKAPDGLYLWADADKLSRVFNNILKNAAAYSYENSTIEISAKQQGEYTIITFLNQGDTIPEEMLNIIFEKFFRLDASRSTHSGGAGLGLAIAKEIVTAHGGEIGAESGGNATVFTVKLPTGEKK